MKKILTTFALAGLVGLAACADDNEPVIMEEPVVEEPAPAPVVTEPAPTAEDSLMMESPAEPTGTTESIEAPAEPM
ncbi:MAG: hypothetical protein WD737_03285 [Gemmatimonadota bacterium]